MRLYNVACHLLGTVAIGMMLVACNATPVSVQESSEVIVSGELDDTATSQPAIEATPDIIDELEDPHTEQAGNTQTDEAQLASTSSSQTQAESEITVQSENRDVRSARWNRGAIKTMDWLNDREFEVHAANGYLKYDLGSMTELREKSSNSIDLLVENDDSFTVMSDSGEVLSTLQEPEPILALRRLHSPDDKLIASYRSSVVFLWDVASGERLANIKTPGDVITVKFSPNSTQLLAVSGSLDSARLSIWDLTTRERIWSEERLMDYVRNVVYSPDGTLLAVVGKTIPQFGSAITGKPAFYIVDIESGDAQPVSSTDFDFSPFDTNPLQFSEDASHLYVAEDANIAEIDVSTANVSQIINLPHYVTHLSVSPTRELVAASDDNVLSFWNLANKEVVVSFSGYANSITSIDFDPATRRLLSVINGLVQIIDSDTLDLLFEAEIDTGDSMIFGPTADTLIRFGSGESILWDYVQNEVRWSHPGNVIHYSADRSELLLAEVSKNANGEQSRAYFVNTASGNATPEFDITDECATVAPSDLNVIAVARESSADRARVSLVDSETGTITGDLALALASGCPVYMDFSPSGRLLAIGENGPRIEIWDITTQERVESFPHEHSSWLMFGFEMESGNPEFANEELLLTFGGGLDTAEIHSWSVPEAENLGKFSESPILSQAYSSDGAKLYAGMPNGMILVLDTVTGELTNAYWGHDAGVTNILLSPDDSAMITASNDGTVIFRQLNTEE